MDSPGLLDFSDEMKFLSEVVQEADILLFVVDGKQEMWSKEQEIHQMICKAGKFGRTIMVVNKLDGKIYTAEREWLIAPWYALGYERVCGVSVEQHEGMEMLFEEIDLLRKEIKIEEATDEEEDAAIERDNKLIHLAIIWRPNAGKSTLLNKLIGEEISYVSDIPGTTLDYLVAQFARKQHTIQLYDTAGIRKKGKTVGLERIAYAKTKSLMEYRHPITIVLIDLEEWLTKRDASLIQEFSEISGPMIVAVNKIDLFAQQDAAVKIKQLQQAVKIPSWIPIVPISWKNAIALPKLMNTVLQVHRAWTERINTGELNSVVTRAWLTKPPRFPKNKMVKWKYITQIKAAPPTFMVSVNDKSNANFSFHSRLEKVIREWFWFIGCPIRLELREKKNDNPYANNYDT